MLSVGLCLSAGLPAGFLVSPGLIGTLGGINDCLIQFQLLPCGAVQPLDFFDHIVGVGSCDTLTQLFPAFLGFGVSQRKKSVNKLFIDIFSMKHPTF